MSISSQKPQMHIAHSVPTEQATRVRARPKTAVQERGGISSKAASPEGPEDRRHDANIIFQAGPHYVLTETAPDSAWSSSNVECRLRSSLNSPPRVDHASAVGSTSHHGR